MAIKTKGSKGLSLGGGPVSSHAAGEWEDAPTEFTRRVAHIDIVGEEGSGKTTLALTARAPIALVNADEKIEGVVQPFARKKQVRMVKFGFVATDDVEGTAARAMELWRNIRGKVRESVEWAGSTIIDTGTDTWELCRLGYFGTLKPQGRTDNLYGPPNNDYRTLLKSFRMQEKANLITIHHTKDEYLDKMVNGRKESIRTGKLLRAGFKELGTMADIVIWTSKTFDEAGNIQFNAEIRKGWFNAATEGLVFTNEDARLPYILATITDTDESEWA